MPPRHGGPREAATGPALQLGLLGQRHGLSSNELPAVAARGWPQPGCAPEPARPGNAGWSAAPAGPGCTSHAAKPTAWSSRSANRARAGGAASVSGPDAASHQTPTQQRPRRSAPTTMFPWRPPWSAQEQFKLTLLPPTRANNSVTARRPPRPGSTAALPARARGTPAPRDLVGAENLIRRVDLGSHRQRPSAMIASHGIATALPHLLPAHRLARTAHPQPDVQERRDPRTTT